MIWHSNTISDVLQELQVDPSAGLNQQEAAARLKEFGKNSLQEQQKASFRQAFSKQLRAPLTALMWVLACLTLLIDLYQHFLKHVPTDWKRSLVVAAMALMITLLNTIRHCRAAAAMATLRSLSVPETRVRRDGTEQLCSTLTLVPGDIVLLRVGDLVPADCRLIEADRLRCDECDLTDATMPTEKYADPVFDDITPLAQRTNMLYAGTAITGGTATAVVVATGARSEMGHQPTKYVQTVLPMQHLADRMTLWLSIAAAGLSILYLIIGLISNPDRAAVLLMVGALAMAAVPQGIASLFTLLSTRSIRRMSRHHLLLNRPEAADTLGCVSVICTEQETLQQGDSVYLCRAFVGHRTVDMTANTPKAPGLGQLMRLAALNTHNGDPIDCAILAFLPKLSIDRNDLLVDMPRIGELDSTDTRKTAVHLAGEQALTLVSGDWRSLLPHCIKGNTEELTAAAEAMEHEGLQVWAVTYRLTDTAPAVYTAAELEQDLTCAGLLGLRIPLNTEAEQPISRVRTILFSHESPAIASAAAHRAGLTDNACVATAEVVDSLTDAQLAEAVKQYNIYCGINVEQKARILTALQQHDTVLLTAGDSAEADLLAAADVGCARGTVAADVTKDAADIILTDDSYTAVVAAVREGHCLRKARTGMIAYLILCVAVIVILSMCSLFGVFNPALGALLIVILHALLLALPTPLLVATGVSNFISE